MLFATATEWVTRLTEAHRAGKLPNELARLRRYGLIIVDEVGYLPFEQDAANLFFQLVSSRYEHASLILTRNLPFSGWGGVFGDQVVAAAMIDRVVHHADVLTLKGASCRLPNRGIDTLPSIRETTDHQPNQAAHKPFTLRASEPTRNRASSTPACSSLVGLYRFPASMSTCSIHWRRRADGGLCNPPQTFASVIAVTCTSHDRSACSWEEFEVKVSTNV